MSIRLPLGWDVTAGARNGVPPIVPPLGGGLFLCGSATPTTTDGYAADPGIAQLILNCIASFKGEGNKKVWIASGASYAVGLRDALTAAGHTVTVAVVPTTLDPDEYDFACLWQTTNLAGADYLAQTAMVWEYISHGGGVYLPMAYPNAYHDWNATLFPHVGLAYSGQYVMGTGYHTSAYDYDEVFAGMGTIWVKFSGGISLRTAGPDFGVSDRFREGTTEFHWWIFGIWRPS